MFLFLFVAIAFASAEDEFKHIDYDHFDHVIELDEFRAGNHDQGGQNDYFFKVNLQVVEVIPPPPAPAPGVAPPPAREAKIVTHELSQFDGPKLGALELWKPSKSDKAAFTKEVFGGEVRNIAAKAIREWKVGEADILVQVEVQVLERNGYYGFFGVDTLIGSVKYPLISPDHPPKEFEDSSGLWLKFTFDFPQLPKTSKTAIVPAAGERPTATNADSPAAKAAH